MLIHKQQHQQTDKHLSGILLLVNGLGNAAAASETDPVFTASPAGSITLTKLTQWDAAYGWGDHGAAGYLSQVALPDLTDVTISSLVTGDLIKYNASTSKWENFTPAYLTAESDTLDTITGRGGTTSNNLSVGDLTVTGNLLVQGTTTNTNVNTLSVLTMRLLLMMVHQDSITKWINQN